jgi:hypothetical protein
MLLPRRAAAFWEGPEDSQGGTGKAEAGKLPGAGIIPKPCPRKGAAEKERGPKQLVVVATAEKLGFVSWGWRVDETTAAESRLD